MGNFSNNAITDVGRMLLADVQAGAIFTPTRIVIGSGSMPSGATTQGMTDVITPVKSLAINKKKRTPDGKCVFGGVYTNEEVTDPFYFRELALYAKAVYLNADGSVKSEGAETLYSYGNAGTTADYMPAHSTSTVVEKQMDLVTWVGNDAQVDLSIESGLYVTHGDFDFHAARHAADGDDPITPESIGAAQGGFGYGGEHIPVMSGTEAQLEAFFSEILAKMKTASTKQIAFGCSDSNMGQMGTFTATIKKFAVDYSHLTASVYGGYMVSKSFYNNAWMPFEWINPPFVAGTEYRTVERRGGVVVYKKLDTDGVLKYRLEGSSAWIPCVTDCGGVKRTGDTMTNDLTIQKATAPSLRLNEGSNGAGAIVQQWGNQLIIANRVEANVVDNYRFFSVNNLVQQDDVAYALGLADIRDGVSKYYTVLHSGNLSVFGLGAVPATVE